MIFVLSHVLAEANDLGRSGFACDIEPGHLDTGSGPAVIDHAPHAIDYNLVLIFRNRHDLRIWPLGIEWHKRARHPIVRIAFTTDGPEFLQYVRNVKFPSDADACNLPERRKRRDDVIDLTEGRIDGVDVAPFRITRVHACFQLRRREGVNSFMGQVDARTAVEIELVNHLHDPFNRHLQTEAIKVSVAGLSDRGAQIRSPMTAHAPGP